jgi:CTP synthase (UTP-ammonia lyase)
MKDVYSTRYADARRQMQLEMQQKKCLSIHHLLLTVYDGAS